MPCRANRLLKILRENCKNFESFFGSIRNFKIEAFTIKTNCRNWNFYPTPQTLKLSQTMRYKP